MEACTKVITERFDEISNREEPELSHLLELDIENFIQILKADTLNLLAEETLINIIRQYVAIREKIGPKKAESAEEATKPELWALLTDAEKENRKVAFQEELDKKVAAEAEMLEKDA